MSAPSDVVQVNMRRFWWGFALAALPAVVYIVTVCMSVEWDHAQRYLKNEVTISLFALFVLPLAFALLASISDPALLRARSRMERRAWVGGFILISGVLAYSTLGGGGDSTPGPHRLNGDDQACAIALDRHLRGGVVSTNAKTCDVAGALGRVSQCRAKYRRIADDADSYPAAERVRALKALERRHAYQCLLLDRSIKRKTGTSTVDGDSPIQGHFRGLMKNNVRAVGRAMEFVLHEIVVYFIMFAYFAVRSRGLSMGARGIYVLFLSYGLMITWFPMKVYTEWYKHFEIIPNLLNNTGFFFLAFIAFLIFVLFAFLFAATTGGYHMRTVIPVVGSSVAALIGVVGYFDPKIVTALFRAFERWSEALYAAAVIVVGVIILDLVKLSLTEDETPALTEDETNG